MRLRAEASRLERELAASQARVVELEGLVVTLRERVATLAKLVFGASSEKKQASQKSTVPSSREDAGAATGEPLRRRGQQPGSTGHGRRDYSGLETVEEIHDLSENERVCPECGSPYAPFGEETSEQVDWQVRIVRIVHRRPTYRRTCYCPVGGVLVAPVPAKPILKGRFTTQFLARLLVEKYVLGRPLERVIAALGADGLEVAKGTLVGVLKGLSRIWPAKRTTGGGCGSSSALTPPCSISTRPVPATHYDAISVSRPRPARSRRAGASW
jgi:transposase